MKLGLALLFVFGGRGQVFDVSFGDGGADAAIKELKNFKGAGEIVLFDDDDFVDADVARGFGGMIANGDATEAAGFGGESAGFEGAHSPKPFVQSRRRLAHGVSVGEGGGKNEGVGSVLLWS